ncbi:hypothetical protein V8F06_000397 [Rhypophila decipiens]
MTSASDFADRKTRTGMSSDSPAKNSPNIQHKQYDTGHNDGMASKSCPPNRPVSWAESTSGLLASGSEMGQMGVGPARRNAHDMKLPVRASTVTAGPASIRVVLAERQYIHEATGRIETPERRGGHASEPDIELDDMASRPVPAQNIDHAVSSVDASQTGQVCSFDRESGESTMASQGSDKRHADLRPNYKPTSLRWPFRVLLLALLAGMLTFLEYHIHDLPPPHYSIFPADRTRQRHLDAVAAAPLIQPATIATKPASPPASSSTATGPVTRPVKLRYNRRSPGPDPDPDPRPPESNYPVPDYYYDMYQTYCGWSPPTWTIDHYGQPCSDFSCDEFPILCSNRTDKTQLQCSLFELTEAMDTFLTDDPTWCPCGVWQPDDWGTIELTEVELYWWDTIDRGCKSAMLAIQSLNHFKSVELYRTISLAETTFTKVTLVAQQFYTKPPLPAEAWWPYPRYSENGDILMPFVVRTAGREIKDVYGNYVEPGDIATFPDGFQSIFFQDNEFNGCWGSLQRYNLKTGPPGRCSDPPHVILSSVWWPLPLHPKTATATTTLESFPATSVLQPGGSTSTTEVPSTSAPVFPSSSIQDPTTSSVPSTQSTVENTRLSTPSSTDRDTITASSGDTNEPAPTASSTSTGEDVITQSARESANPTPTPSYSSTSGGTLASSTRGSGNPTTKPSSSSSQHEPDNTSSESTDERSETSRPASLMTTETSDISTPGPNPLSSSSVRSDTVDEAEPVSDATSRTAPTSSPVIVPVVGLVPGQSSSNSLLPSMNSGTSISPQTTPKQRPAQFITSMATEFDPNGIPTRTFTTIISSAASSSILYIPPPPFIIPVGSGWIPHVDDSNANGKPGSNFTGPGGHDSGPIAPADQARLINLRTEADYLMASVVPVLLASFLLIAVQIFNSSVNSILPFRALTFAQGSCANESLLLSRSSNIFVSQPKVAYRFLARFRDPLPFLNTLLASFALLMVPLSSEVIRLEFTKKCGDPNWLPEYVDKDDHDYPANWVFFSRVCAFGLRKSVTMIRVAEGVLVAMAAIVLFMGWLLTRWRSGMVSEPWSIASMASLLAGPSRSSPPTAGRPGECTEPQQRHQPPDLAALLQRVPTTGPDIDTELKSTLQDRSFRLGFLSAAATGKKTYGIEVTALPHCLQDDKNPTPRITTRNPPGPPADQPFSRVLRRSTTLLSLAPAQSNNGMAKKRIPIPLITTSLFTTGLLILVIYYETTVIEVKDARGQTAPKYKFEAFMNSQSFGVRILFTAFGVIMSTFWDSYFLSTSEFQIHHRLAQKDGGLPAERSILLSPAAHIFAGIWSSLSLFFRHTLNTARGSDKLNKPSNDYTSMSSQDLKSFNIALATFFAKFMPILLSNIPFHNTVTWKMHEACTWMAVIFMGYMVLLLLFIFAVDLFHMHMQPFQKFGWFGRGTRSRLEDTDQNKKKKNVVYMPVRVNTLAGCMYYLCESRMINDFKFDLVESDMSEPTGRRKKDQKWEQKLENAVVALDKRYFFGRIVGQTSGATRLAVDYYCSTQRHDESSSRSLPPPPLPNHGRLLFRHPEIDREHRRLFARGNSRRPGRLDDEDRTMDGDLDIERGR